MQFFLALADSSWTSGLPAASTAASTIRRFFQEGETIPGSTDGILLMGIIIVIIVVIPIVWTRRRWMR